MKKAWVALVLLVLLVAWLKGCGPSDPNEAVNDSLAAAARAGKKAARVEWDPIDPNGLQHYILYRGLDSQCSGALTVTNVLTTLTGTLYADTNLPRANGKTFRTACYEVSGVNINGVEGPHSTRTTVTWNN